MANGSFLFDYESNVFLFLFFVWLGV